VILKEKDEGGRAMVTTDVRPGAEQRSTRRDKQVELC